MQLPIVKKLCGANEHEAASLIKELIKNMEEISLLAGRQLLRSDDNSHHEVFKEINALARDSIEHAKSK